MTISDRRIQVAEKVSQGIKADQIAQELGYASRESVYSALESPEVKEQITFHRDNLFHQSRIDRVKLLRELYQRATQETGPIFKTLRGEGNFLDAANLEKLLPEHSRLIQQVEVEPTLIKERINGDMVTRQVSIVKKLRFHSPDSALKILSKAAGFEDGVLSVDTTEIGGPFRGLVIIPPGQPLIDTKRVEEGPPETGL